MFGGAVYPIPDWLAELIGTEDEALFERGASHKYIRKIPAGIDPKTGRQRFRYFYTVTQGRLLGHKDELVQGAAFRFKHRGKQGHLHIVADKGKDRLHIRHDETGQEAIIHRDVLADLLHREHAEMIERAHDAPERIAKLRSPKLRDKALARHRKVVKHFARPRQANERVDLGTKATSPDDASRAAFFTTRAAAMKAASAIGYGGDSVKRVHPYAKEKLPGATWAKWVIAEPGTHRAITAEAYKAMSGRSTPRKLHAARRFVEDERPPEEKPEKHWDVLPRSRAEVVEAIADASGIDLGAVEPDRFLDHISAYLPEKKLKELRRLPAKQIVKEGMKAVIAESGAKTWGDVQELLPRLSEFEDWASGENQKAGRSRSRNAEQTANREVTLRLPQGIADRIEEEKLAEQQAEYYRGLGIDPDDPSTWPASMRGEEPDAERDAIAAGEGGDFDTSFNIDEFERSLARWNRRLTQLRKGVPTDMPSNIVKTERDERLWKKAKKIAADAGKAENYAYVNGVYQRMKKSAEAEAGEPLRRSAAAQYLDHVRRDDVLSKSLYKAVPGEFGGDWTEKFAGTPLHEKALDCALAYRKELDAIDRRFRERNASNASQREQIQRQMRELEERQRKLYEGEAPRWEQEAKCREKYADEMGTLETRLLELRRDQARASSSAMSKSAAAGGGERLAKSASVGFVEPPEPRDWWASINDVMHPYRLRAIG